jgi:glycosyltransferase involved in cell wall biosynthesis
MNLAIMRGKRILYVVADDQAFVSRRLQLALAARNAGSVVAVATRVGAHAEAIRAAGIDVFPIRFDRGLRGPNVELATVADIVRAYKSFRPDLVHHVALKPILLGSLAAAMAGVPQVVNAMTGRGFVFLSNRLLARCLRPPVRLALMMIRRQRNGRVILQNPDDLDVWGDRLPLGGKFVVIRGSGIDVRRFEPSPEPSPPVVVTLPSRLLWEKGVGEFVEAAKMLRGEGVRATFQLVGNPDAENPATVDVGVLEGWHRSGIISWRGWHEDMREVYRSSHIVCLPSYSEGLPNVLLEAGACGRPLITTDVPGCREVVTDGENGLLVPVKDSRSLAAALRRLIASPELRAAMGRKARETIVNEFAIESVIAQTLNVYENVLHETQR